MSFDGSWQRRLLKTSLFSLGVLTLVTNARAQRPQCTFNMSSISFGTVDVTNGRPYDATGTFTYACTGDAQEMVRICPSLAIPKEGPRYMTDAAGHQLFYNLYTDEARTEVWGSWFSKVKAPTIETPVGRSEKTTGSAVIYARLEPGQKDAPPGVYTASIAGGHAVATYDYVKEGRCVGSIHGPWGKLDLTITARVGNGGDSLQPMVAPDATHPSNSSSSVPSGQRPEAEQKRSLLQKLRDNAAYQQRKQEQAASDGDSRDSDSKKTKRDDQEANRAAYLESHSCMTTMGAEKAGQLSDDCNRTTSAPHTACNIQQNTCDEIKDATKRGCDGLGAQAPDFCFTRYR